MAREWLGWEPTTTRQRVLVFVVFVLVTVGGVVAVGGLLGIGSWFERAFIVTPAAVVLGWVNTFYRHRLRQDPHIRSRPQQ